MKPSLLNALALAALFAGIAHADMKPMGTVLSTKCGKTMKDGEVYASVVAVKEVCYARVVGVRTNMPFLMVILNDGSEPKLYEMQREAQLPHGFKPGANQTAVPYALQRIGTVVRGKLQYDVNTGIIRGSAVELQEQGLVVELSGRLPGNLHFVARDFRDMFHTMSTM